MSAIFKIVGLNFKNPNLLVLSEKISNGLVAMFRPDNTLTGLVDLSGNGSQLTIQGSPQLTSNSAIVDKNNGFLTDVRETTDLTMIVVSRVIKNAQATGNDQWLGMIVGTYTNGRGVSLFNSASNQKNQVDVLGQSYAKKTSDGSMASKTTWNGSFDNASGITQTDYQFNAIVVKASDNKVLTYTPAKQSTPMFVYDGSTDGYRVDLRNLSDTATGLPNYFKIGIANVPFGDGRSEIAEVLIYNRALTQEEIVRQYQYSKDFMSKHRGISI